MPGALRVATAETPTSRRRGGCTSSRLARSPALPRAWRRPRRRRSPTRRVAGGERGGLGGPVGPREEALEAEVKRLRGAPPDWRERAAEWLDELGLGYGGALLYFTLVPLWWPGQTAGKSGCSACGGEITGAPMTATARLQALRRLHGRVCHRRHRVCAQVTWDPNAQGLHDRAACTLVLDERAAAAARPPADARSGAAEQHRRRRS